MIRAIGLDIVAVERIARACENPRFIERILTPLEREQALTMEQIAARWAAKEAAYKCWNGLRSWHDAQIVKNSSGCPQLQILKDQPSSNWAWHLSLSHDNGMAAAVVILESWGD